MARTTQEKRYCWAILETLMDLYQKDDGFFCRGVEIAITPEIDALVAKILDVNCHGGSVRKDHE